jgi:alpha-D-xyloside xylohydrolase
MDKPLHWSEIAAPLDVRQIYAPALFIRRWVDYRKTSNGISFQCELADGCPVEYRVDVLDEDMLRLRMGLPKVVEKQSDILIRQEFTPFPFQLSETPDGLTLSTNRIRIEIPRLWQITAYDSPEPGQGRVFYRQRTDDRSYGPGFEVAPTGYEAGPDGHLTVRESAAVQPGESFYGLGERFTSLDRWNQELVSWAVDCGNVTSRRAYKNVPLLLSSQGYGLFVHSSYPMVFRMGSQSSITYSIHVAEDQLDLFLFYGPQFKQILSRYTEITGRAPVPPKWSFGFWISRCGYKSREEVETVVAGFRARGFPLDVISLDPWWMGAEPWTTFTWDEEAFTRPEEMLRGLRDQGVRTCLWIHPYIPPGTPLYDEGVQKGYFVRSPDGSPAPVLEAFSGNDLAAVDFTNPAATAWWQSQLERLMDQGVAVFKTDFGEQAPVDAIYSDGRCGLEMHNLYPLLYNRAAFELTERKNGRGLVWGRSGYAGSQRYPVQWGGDSYSSLDQMAGQLRGLLGYGLSGVPFCSHDVGGFDFSPHFFDDTTHVTFQESYDAALKESYPKDPVTYVRWLQFGVFSSHIRAHGKQPREPWTYGPEVEAVAHRYLTLRYRLLPYLYNQALLSSRSGLPLVRPMVLEFQDDPNTARLEHEYMFGNDFLVAPVLSEDGWSRVYLPKGIWVDYWSKEIVQGERWLEVCSPLERIPLWVRGGAVIPMGPEQNFVDERPLSPLTLELYTPEGSGQLSIEDEDQPGVLITYERSGEELRVRFGPTPGMVEILIYGCALTRASDHSGELALSIVPGGVQVKVDGRSGGEVLFA